MLICEEMDEIEVQLVCACRVCLATDVRLEALYPGPLAETYEQFTGTTVSPTDGLQQYLCSMCAALLKKSAAFQSKCLNTLALLQMVRQQLQSLSPPLIKTEITMPLIRNLDRKYLKLPYVTSDMLTVSALGDSSNTIKKEVIELKEEESEEDCMLDCESPVEQSEEKEILIDLNITGTINPIESVAVEYDPYPTLLYDDVLDNKESSCKVECDMVDCDTETNTVINTVDNSFNKSVVSETGNTVTDNTKLNKTVLSKCIKTPKKPKRKRADLKRWGGDVHFKTKEALDEFGKSYNFKTKEQLSEFGNKYNFDVIIMTKNEQILDLEQSRKKCLLYQKGRFKCEECFRGFTSETVYKNHMAVHDPASGSHVCEVCKHRYPTVRKLKNHRRQHRVKFICRECQQRSRTSALAREHYRAHTGASYECQFCGATFRKYASRSEHVRIHHGANTCDICYEGLNGATGIALHKASVHKKTYQCASCDVHFDNAHAMTRHIGSSPNGACDPNIRACAKCGEPCASAELLDEHVARAHPQRRLRPFVIREQVEVRCDDPAAAPRPARRPHRKKPHVQVPVPMEVCETPKPTTSFHITSSQQQVEVQCDDPAAAPRPARRPRAKSCNGEKKKRMERKCCGCPHIEVGHDGDGESVVPNSGACPCGDEEPECLCPLGSSRSCRRRDRSPRNVGGVLRKDKWVGHKGCCHELRLKKRTMMCEICAATFRLAAQLKEHQRIHTGEKPFQCRECHKRFRLKQSLRLHINSHTGERPYKCSLCPKAFTTPMNKTIHVQRHSEGRPYSCEACGKTFKTSTQRNQHVLLVHKKIPQPPRVRNRKRKIECTNSE